MFRTFQKRFENIRKYSGLFKKDLKTSENVQDSAKEIRKHQKMFRTLQKKFENIRKCSGLCKRDLKRSENAQDYAKEI